MLKRSSIGMLVVALIVLMVIPAVSAKPGGIERPFKATLTGEASWEFPGRCGNVTTVTDATGKATHMGSVKADWTHCPDNDTINDGEMTLIAANGDELHGYYDYPGIDAGSPITFDGGTGRFANAVGEVLVHYDVIPVFWCEPADWNDEDAVFACMDFTVPWQWTATLTGTISY